MPEPAIWPVMAVLVLAAVVLWPAAAVAEDDDEEDDDAAAELLVEVAGALPALLTRDLPEPYDPEVTRLPRKRGAISAANFSALTTPLTRMVLSKSPTRIVAVRS